MIVLTDVYFRHKTRLLQILPLEDPLFIAHLQGNGLLRDGDLVHVIDSKHTRASKVYVFLKYAIEPSLKDDEKAELEKLLSVMERSDNSCKRLANKIRNEIPCSNTTG